MLILNPFSVFSIQFESSDDPLEQISTAEAIRTLIDFYRSSQQCYAAKEKVEEMSKFVSLLLATSILFSWNVLECSIVLQKGTVLDLGGSQASFFMQAFTLTKIRSL